MRSLQPAIVLTALTISLLEINNAGEPQKHKDKSKPVRAALEYRYVEMRAAYLVQDSSIVLANRHPDCFSISPRGDTVDCPAMRAYIRASFEQVENTVALDWKLGVIDVHGDTAAAEVDQHWVRRQLKGGAVRNVDTEAHQRETWIREGNDWFLWRIDHVVPGVWRVDGTRIDPSKPYDPKAPEYRPK
jgi:hypothetical protein